MKKLTLATAVALLATAGTANAAITMYEKDNFTYTLKGDVQIQLLDQSGIDTDIDVNYDDAELKHGFAYDLGNGTTAFAQVDFDYRGESSQEAYVGMDFGNFKFWYGKTDYVTDAFGVEKNIDVVNVAGDTFVETGSDDLLLVQFKAGPATIGLSHDLSVGEVAYDDDGDILTPSIIVDELTSTDLNVSVPVGPVDLGFAYQDLSALDDDHQTAALSGKFAMGPVSLGLSYSASDGEISGADYDASNIHAVVTFPVAPTTKASIGIDLYDLEVEGEDDYEQESWYANVTYKFPTAKNVSVFAEVADTDIEDYDVGYLVGMRVQF